MTWADYKLVVSEIDACCFDITENKLNEIAYDFLLTDQDHTTENIERFAMMKGAD